MPSPHNTTDTAELYAKDGTPIDKSLLDEICIGNAYRIKNFGCTKETEALMEMPHIQKCLLNGDIPYLCELCETIFFADQPTLAVYKRAYEWAGCTEVPQLLCARAYVVVVNKEVQIQVVSAKRPVMSVTEKNYATII